MKIFKTPAFLISLIYILIGVYDYYSSLSISKYFDSIKDDLGMELIFPSNMFGILLRRYGAFILETDAFFWIGQIIGLTLYFLILLVVQIGISYLVSKAK